MLPAGVYAPSDASATARLAIGILNRESSGTLPASGINHGKGYRPITARCRNCSYRRDVGDGLRYRNNYCICEIVIFWYGVIDPCDSGNGGSDNQRTGIASRKRDGGGSICVGDGSFGNQDRRIRGEDLKWAAVRAVQ